MFRPALTLFFLFSFVFLPDWSINSLVEVLANGNSTTYGYISRSSLEEKEQVIEIQGIVDLKGEILEIPSNCLLKFNRGRIINGKVIGSRTRIERINNSAIFHNVSIGGTWNVTDVSSSFFLDKSYCLEQVFALTDPTVYNKVVIEKGKYYVSRSDLSEGALNIKSNTDLIIKGEIIVTPNNYSHYYILNLKDVKNVTVSGGAIVGDRNEHIGNSGEWGHGIFVWGNSENIVIDGVRIRNCWGDGVAIGRSEAVKNVELANLRIENCRRNGISVIACDGCCIRNCSISNIEGTAPEYAVDIEPNKSGHVSDVLLSGLKIRGKSGILVPIANADDQHFIKKIRINNCDIRTIKRCVSIDGADGVIIDGNKLINKTEDESIPLVIDHDSKDIIITNNQVVKRLRNHNSDASVLFVNPEKVTITSNLFRGEKCSLGYFVNGNHVIKNNTIKCSVGFIRIRNSKIENNIYRGGKFIPNPDNGCVVTGNRVRSINY